MKISREKMQALGYTLRHPDFHAAARRAGEMITGGWYNKGDEQSGDRMRLLFYHYEANIVANWIGGTFYTGLLLLLNADDAFIGTLSLISSAANMLQLFAPLLMERFSKRKKLMIWMRAIILFMNIVVLGITPLLPVGQQGRLLVFAGTVLLMNVLNAFLAPGFSVWTMQSLPERVRGSFFTVITMTVGAVVAVFNLIGSNIVDFFDARGQEYLGLMILRAFCVIMVVADTISYARIKEYPYPGSDQKFTVKDMLLSPFKEKKYLRTVAMTFLWNIAANIPGSYYTVYLLQEIEVNYSFIMTVSMLNVPAVLLLTPVWSKMAAKYNMSWFKMLYVAMGFYMIHYVLLGLVTPGTVWLYPVACMLAYVMGIGINLSFTCIPYVNIPEKNQTAFIGFYSAVANLAVFVGVFIGRQFVTHTESLHFELLGMPFGGKQMLVFLTAAMMAISVACIAYIDKINTAEDRKAKELQG